MMWHLVFLVLAALGNETEKEWACYRAVGELSKSKEFDIKSILQSSSNFNPPRLINYILNDMYETCMEIITPNQIEEMLNIKPDEKVKNFLNINIKKYIDIEIEDEPPEFFQKMMDFKQKHREL